MKHRQDKPVIYWLGTGCLLVLIMVVVGAITRLTHSGLSMVQWNLIMGSIPPLTEASWNEAFELYKETPEFRLINYDFTLEEFKSIFWWEYIHRMIGRLIGLVFIIPFFFFLIKKRFSKSFLIKLLILFGLGAFQGFMGWYMVKSGLVKNPAVSHYRLASHLVIAFGLYGYTFWLMLEKIYGFTEINVATKKLQKAMIWVLGILTVQIVYGAFVSGLKAGLLYNTFPKMGQDWIAQSVTYSFQTIGMDSLLESHATVQLMHRYLAYGVVLLVVLIWNESRKTSLFPAQLVAIRVLLVVVLMQFLLGVFTLIFAVPVSLGVLHQFGAVILLTCGIYFFYQIRYTRFEGPGRS